MQDPQIPHLQEATKVLQAPPPLWRSLEDRKPNLGGFTGTRAGDASDPGGEWVSDPRSEESSRACGSRVLHGSAP